MARAAIGALVAVLAFGAGAASAARPLVTGVSEPLAKLWSEPEARLAYQRINAAGSGSVKIWVEWRLVAPDRPLDAANPADPAYRWDGIDRAVRLAGEAGLRVILTLYESPQWAETTVGPLPGSGAPTPGDLGLFARAVAERYDGDFDPDGLGLLTVLPEVPSYEIWNEPNLAIYFMPQRDGAGRSVAPTLYRELVNAAATSIHAVDPRNNVVAGVLAPFGPVEGHMPLDFMRKLLCMSGGKAPRPVCREKIAFDVWSHHPYTQGGPTHHAYWPDDVSLGDLGEMRRLLRAAVRAGNVVHSRPVPFWVTEFSWETSPPDRQGVPSRRHARWTAEALYRMWANGVSLVTWWLLRDRPFPQDFNQSGLYFCGQASLADEGTCQDGALAGDARKRSFRAFRFPFVAFPRNGRLFVWGRTPAGEQARVLLQVKTARGWRRFAVLRANEHGIFTRTLRVSMAGRLVRARIVGRNDASLAFRAAPTRDVALAHPFGCGGGLPC